MAPTPIKESSIYGDFSSIASRTNSKATANPTLEILDTVEMSMDDFAEKNSSGSLAVKDLLINFFSEQKIKSALMQISLLKVFSHEIHQMFENDLEALGSLKQLKYFYNLPIGQVFEALSQLYKPNPNSNYWKATQTRIYDNDLSSKRVCDFLKDQAVHDYDDFAHEMVKKDPHAVFPTNIYRQCDGYTVSTKDCSTIESVMSTTLTTTIKIRQRVLDLDNDTLSSIYQSLGRCIAIVDDKVQGIFGQNLADYFAHHKIQYKPLVYKGNEVDKEIASVEQILVDLKKNGISRNEPVLIIGGGVISDIGGFACALYHRSTPYVMLCTSIVSGIDAGPSPRTCCDGFGYKNLYGAYHPPIQTITDRYFFKSLHQGWLRHGIAEIIKMAVTKDYELFQLLEKAGPKLITSKFGTDLNSDSSDSEECDTEFENICDLIIGRALDSYVKSEYGNLWETHQARPHAYGHTWSPGYELSAGMLHGHAVATGMGFGAYMSHSKGWINNAEFQRILNLISSMELSLWHPIMDDVDMIWSSQVKMVQKRGGHLCAPIPQDGIGKCGYLNDMPYDMLKSSLAKYKQICFDFPRQGLGVEVHCSDVGLGDPSVTAKLHIRTEKNRTESESGTKSDEPTSYQEWIKQAQVSRNTSWKFNVALHESSDTANPPHFDKVTLFHAGIEDYATANTSLVSDDVQVIATSTNDQNLFAPCMVGTLESQFLKLQMQVSGAKKVLDIGTFTGMSALAMAEGLPRDGQVVTLENSEECANVAEECFKKAKHGAKIKLLRGDAIKAMKKMLKDGEQFDVIFIDADKENYIHYYNLAMSGLLSGNGFILADNSMCALLYDETDERSKKLHEFNQFIKNDKRVEQVILTIREGISMIKPIKN